VQLNIKYNNYDKTYIGKFLYLRFFLFISQIVFQITFNNNKRIIFNNNCKYIALQHCYDITVQSCWRRTFLWYYDIASMLQLHCAISLQYYKIATKYFCNHFAIFLCCMGYDRVQYVHNLPYFQSLELFPKFFAMYSAQDLQITAIIITISNNWRSAELSSISAGDWKFILPRAKALEQK